MKRMDEMDRIILLQSEALGFKATLLALSAWTLFNSWQTLMYGVRYNPLPFLILCFVECAQGFSQMYIKQKMVAGDEEYREPNKLLQTITASIVLIVLILSVGTYLLVRE